MGIFKGTTTFWSWATWESSWSTKARPHLQQRLQWKFVTNPGLEVVGSPNQSMNSQCRKKFCDVIRIVLWNWVLRSQSNWYPWRATDLSNRRRIIEQCSGIEVRSHVPLCSKNHIIKVRRQLPICVFDLALHIMTLAQKRLDLAPSFLQKTCLLLKVSFWTAFMNKPVTEHCLTQKIWHDSCRN